MPTVERTFEVDPGPDVVIDYLKDFGNATEWDPGTDRCTRIGDGPIAVGARWLNTSTVFGMQAELEYELTELREDGVTFVGRNDSVVSTDEIRVTASGRGSTITYRADLDLQGIAAVAAPIAKVGFEKIANDTEEQMTTVINALGRGGSGVEGPE